jgi:hypothetical protein
MENKNINAHIKELVKEDFASFDENEPAVEQAKKIAEYQYSEYFRMLKELGIE